MINVIYTKDFKKSFKKKGKFIREKTLERVRLFREDPFNVLLDNHKLNGEYEGSSSIKITGNFRAIFKYINTDTVVFSDIGTHTELYE